MKKGIVTRTSKTPTGFPWVTVTIIFLCTAVMLLYAGLSPLARQAMLELGGVVPAELSPLLGRAGGWSDEQVLTLFSALFIHANWLHLVGNMVYLWVFGLALERRVGKLGMLLIFVAGGALSNLFAVARVPDLAAPIIGASGAVSAIVGAYLGLFPFRRIGVLLPLGLYLQFARIPAVLVIGSWFTLQLVYSVLGPITGIVAWWTHMAGFTLGLIFSLLVRAMAQVKLG